MEIYTSSTKHLYDFRQLRRFTLDQMIFGISKILIWKFRAKEVLIMTRNQIEYGKLLESRRSNQANERLTGRRDEAAIQARTIELAELGRHNVATEGLQAQQISLNAQTLGETIRHNRQTESVAQGQLELGRGQLSETRRHNQAQERATVIQLNEQSRHNLVTEAETGRHNSQTEQLQSEKQGEEKRHNIVSETTAAGKLALDTLTREQQLAETARHNRVMELKDYSTHVTQTATPSYVPLQESTIGNTGTTNKSAPKTAAEEDYQSMAMGYGGKTTTWRGGGFTKNSSGFGSTNTYNRKGWSK